MNEEIIPEYFTKSMEDIAWSVKEYGLEGVAVNVEVVEGEKVFSVIHVDTAKALPLYEKPKTKLVYNREDV